MEMTVQDFHLELSSTFQTVVQDLISRICRTEAKIDDYHKTVVEKLDHVEDDITQKLEKMEQMAVLATSVSDKLPSISKHLRKMEKMVPSLNETLGGITQGVEQDGGDGASQIPGWQVGRHSARVEQDGDGA